MENIRMSFASLQRILEISCKASDLSQYEIDTLRHLCQQFNQEERERLIEKYGKKLKFLDT